MPATQTSTRTLPLACRATLQRIRRTRSARAVSPTQELRHPVSLLVEHRDEAFARLAYDLAEFGVPVLRAKTAFEAQKLCGRYRPMFVVSNTRLLDHSGWLLAAKLQLVDPEIRIWLYQPQISPYDQRMARFLAIDVLLPYGGDLLRLSDAVVRVLTAGPARLARTA